MAAENTTVFLYIDEEEKPIAKLESPVLFELDTTKLTDGKHVLRIVSKFGEKEGLRVVNFTVANGPIIHLEGLRDNATIDGVVPIMLNSYHTGNNKSFFIRGSENPRVVPAWVWVAILFFVAWGLFYLFQNFSMPTASAVAP